MTDKEKKVYANGSIPTNSNKNGENQSYFMIRVILFKPFSA